MNFQQISDEIEKQNQRIVGSISSSDVTGGYESQPPSAEVSSQSYSGDGEITVYDDAFVPETPERDMDDIPEIPPPPKKRSKFTLHSRTLFLTYPQCSLDKEEAFLKVAEITGEPKEWIVAREPHKVNMNTELSNSSPAPYLSATKFINNTSEQNKAFFAMCNQYFHNTSFNFP